MNNKKANSRGRYTVFLNVCFSRFILVLTLSINIKLTRNPDIDDITKSINDIPINPIVILISG
ncbi:hypothetical protein AYK21_02770 [Thermoplasmatales archaeon SG8-52-2]|nr:MAG: hypothetical protein AYK21_02770 [Thermoplasmatales archaeon SG8-52-2]